MGPQAPRCMPVTLHNSNVCNPFAVSISKSRNSQRAHRQPRRAHGRMKRKGLTPKIDHASISAKFDHASISAASYPYHHVRALLLHHGPGHLQRQRQYHPVRSQTRAQKATKFRLFELHCSTTMQINSLQKNLQITKWICDQPKQLLHWKNNRTHRNHKIFQNLQITNTFRSWLCSIKIKKNMVPASICRETIYSKLRQH